MILYLFKSFNFNTNKFIFYLKCKNNINNLTMKVLANKLSLFKNTLNRDANKLFANNFFKLQFFNFTGITETGYKFTTPLMRMRNIKPIAPPGLDLKAPADWTVKKFFEKLGGDCHNHVSKFQTVQEVLDNANNKFLSKKELPIKQRKYLIRNVDLMRRGLLTFEYLDSRIKTAPCRKLTKPVKKEVKKKKEEKEKK
jgi:hypothetical protein